jgi:twinkle protein
MLVIHPRKEEDNQLLGMSSIFGTAKATQEADLVLILQRLKEGMALSVKKNRYNGHVGKIDINFNEALTLFHEVD